MYYILIIIWSVSFLKIVNSTIKDINLGLFIPCDNIVVAFSQFLSDSVKKFEE